MDITSRRFTAFSKEDCRRLQVIQNKILRYKTNLFTLNTPTSDLLDASGDLSVHQLAALHTLLTVFRIVTTRQPEYLAKKLAIRTPDEDRIFPSRQLYTRQVRNDLTIGRSGLINRGGKLWNYLPLDIRQEYRPAVFKSNVRNWSETPSQGSIHKHSV